MSSTFFLTRPSATLCRLSHWQLVAVVLSVFGGMGRIGGKDAMRDDRAFVSFKETIQLLVNPDQFIPSGRCRYTPVLT